MDSEPRTPHPTTGETDFAEPETRKTLEWLRDTETSLRQKTLTAIAPILPDNITHRLETASELADTSLDELAQIDLEALDDAELKPFRLQIGLMFAGFGALSILLLLLYWKALHPNLGFLIGMRTYWYQYAFLVSLGVTGMLLLGREALRDR